MSRKFGMWMMKIWTKNLKQTLDTFLAQAKFSLQIWTTNPWANLRSGRSDARPPFVQKKEKFLKKIGYFWSSVHSNTFFSAKVLVQNTAKELCKRLLDSLRAGTDIQTLIATNCATTCGPISGMAPAKQGTTSSRMIGTQLSLKNLPEISWINPRFYKPVLTSKEYKYKFWK